MTKSIPASVLKAMHILQNPNVNMAEIVQTINYDPGLTSNVLKLANSSMFGLTRSIGSLRDAIVRLGTENIFKLVTTSVVGSSMNKPLPGYGYSSGEFWEHSIAVATSSETLSDLLDTQIINLPFTGGLLHDVGKIILAQFVEKHWDQMDAVVRQGNSVEEAESVVLTIDHAELGSMLLESWNLPESLVETVKYHHDPESAPNEVAMIVNAADYLCNTHEIGSSVKKDHLSFPVEYFEKLGISDEIYQEWTMRTKDSFENIKDVFSNKGDAS